MAKKRPGTRGPSAPLDDDTQRAAPAQEERRGLRSLAEQAARTRATYGQGRAGHAEYDDGRVVAGRGRPPLLGDDESAGDRAP